MNLFNWLNKTKNLIAQPKNKKLPEVLKCPSCGRLTAKLQYRPLKLTFKTKVGPVKVEVNLPAYVCSDCKQADGEEVEFTTTESDTIAMNIYNKVKKALQKLVVK